MSIFKRKQKEEEVKETWTAAKAEESSEPIEVEEEWVWVEGYKGTDANMRCRDYQYELGKRFDMPEGAEIKECENGFHLCLNLKDVYTYYEIGNRHRFFKVQAFVRKKDFDKYGSSDCRLSIGGTYYPFGLAQNKLAAKSINFVSELTYDEILKGTNVEKLPEKYKDVAIKNSIDYAISEYQIDTLVEDGYSTAFSASIVKSNLFAKAHAVGSQSDMSMDMKVLWILS